MRRFVGFALGCLLGCGPGAVNDDSADSATSDTTGTTDSGTTDPRTTDPWGPDDATDTDDPPSVPLTTCTASLFMMDDIYQLATTGFPNAPIIAREDGSLVSVHIVGDQYDSNYHIRAWNADGTLAWDQLFASPQGEIAPPTLAHDAFGDLYLGHALSNAGEALSITKFSGADGAESWTYGTAQPGYYGWVTEMLFDSGGNLLASMTLYNLDLESDLVVKSLDPDNGTELGWHVQWDGHLYSYDAGGLALDPMSGRVFAGGTGDIGIVVLAWDPPSTTPTWIAQFAPDDGVSRVVDLELTSSGKLVAVTSHYVENGDPIESARMFALDPDDGHLIWSADEKELGFGTAWVYAIDMARTPDGGVAVSGIVRSEGAGFLLRLDENLQVYCLDFSDLGLADGHALNEIAVAPNGQIYAGGYSEPPGGYGTWLWQPLIARWD